MIVRKYGKIVVLFALCLLLLTGCTQPRVLTELPDGEIVEYVELRDGFLRFADGGIFAGGTSSIAARIINLPYEDVVADLEFDPVEMSLTLPEKFHMTEESLEKVREGTTPPYKMPLGGYAFSRKGDPGEYQSDARTIYPEFRLILKRVAADEQYYPMHRYRFIFRTLPWELEFSSDKLRDDLRSEVNGHELAVLHSTSRAYIHFPGVEWDYFYGGFYVGDLSVCIESKYGYCTQAEFVEVFLAIFDYLTALEG